MKSSSYVKQFFPSLDGEALSAHAKHTLVERLFADFNEMIDHIKKFDYKFEPQHFARAVHDIRAKFDGINNKLIREVNKDVWGMLYAKIVVVRERLLPEYDAEIKLNREKSKTTAA